MSVILYSQVRVEVEEEWWTVRKYLDPKSQLKGVDKGRLTPKVCEGGSK